MLGFGSWGARLCVCFTFVVVILAVQALGAAVLGAGGGAVALRRRVAAGVRNRHAP